jgi:hypothetical protein
MQMQHDVEESASALLQYDPNSSAMLLKYAHKKCRIERGIRRPVFTR